MLKYERGQYRKIDRILLKLLRKIEHMLHRSKCSISHNIFKYMIFQRRQKELLWSKWLRNSLLHSHGHCHDVI